MRKLYIALAVIIIAFAPLQSLASKCDSKDGKCNRGAGRRVSLVSDNYTPPNHGSCKCSTGSGTR